MTQVTIEQAIEMAVARHSAGQLEHAAAILRQVHAVAPAHPQVIHWLGRTELEIGLALHRAGRLEEAVASYRKAIAVRKDLPEACSNLGVALQALNRSDEAVAAFRQAISLCPTLPDAQNNLARALYDRDELGSALVAYRDALKLRPDHPEALNGIACSLHRLGRLDEAIAAARNGLSLLPDNPELHLNLGMFLLSKSEFVQGWWEHEWRWKIRNASSPPRNFAQPQWDGSAMSSDRTILIHAEQGFGDAIQFVRYLPLVAERGGRIILECSNHLQSLFRSSFNSVEQFVAPGESLPAFDVHCPLLSLPRVLGTTIHNIPRDVPYLKADQDRLESWRGRIPQDNRSFKVGLAWSGNAQFTQDHFRSIPLKDIVVLQQVEGVQFFSLQKSDPGDAKPVNHPFVDCSADLHDFSDTAAMIQQLDLVISVDTAVAHLAGALAKPVWVMLPHIADWRWMLDRTDSPWYPTMRLFRQPDRGDWARVIQQVEAELRNSARRRGS